MIKTPFHDVLLSLNELYMIKTPIYCVVLSLSKLNVIKMLIYDVVLSSNDNIVKAPIYGVELSSNELPNRNTILWSCILTMIIKCQHRIKTPFSCVVLSSDKPNMIKTPFYGTILSSNLNK